MKKDHKYTIQINHKIEDYSMKIKSEPSYKEMKTEELEIPDSDQEEIHFVNKCSICHDIFSSKPTLMKHIRITHKRKMDISFDKENSSFKCGSCGKTSSRKGTLILLR